MMNFEYTLFHPKGEIKVKVTGASPQASVACIQMGHEIIAMMGAEVVHQPPVEIAPEPAMTATVAVAPTQVEEAVAIVETLSRGITVDGNPYPENHKVDTAGTPFDPELHTGTVKKDGTWRLKKGAAAKVEDEGEPEGNGPAPSAEPTTEAMPAEPAEATTAGTETLTAPAAADEELPEITDTELQRYCGRLTQHFGSAEPVFALAAKHVPDGDMPRPTAIKDQAARRAFIEEAQEQTGVVYHG
jgi:hypothetical protein